MKRALALLTLVLVWAVALPASAHVTVSSPDARPGADAALTFRVPTESDTASTTALSVALPTFADVSVLPQPGWTARRTKTGNTVTRIDWTADSAAAAIKPGQFGEFTIFVESLPKAASVSFGVLQTYSDGTVVRWNQTAAPGSSAEPDHPKPTLELSADVAPKAAPSTVTPTILAVVALVLAAAALGVAVVGNARRRTPA